MDTRPLDSFPAFRLRPAGPEDHDLLDPDGRTVGQVRSCSGGGHRARVGRDVGPIRPSLLSAGDDAAMFHIAAHGLPDAPPTPYSGAPEARVAVGLIPLQRQDLIDTTARVFTFYALREPSVAAILDGLETVRRELDAVHSRTGCRRIARLIPRVQVPAQTLLDASAGDARDWLGLPLARLLTLCHQARVRLEATAAQPPAGLSGRYAVRHGADADLATLHRIWQDLCSTSSSGTDFSGIEAAMGALPVEKFAGSARNCRSTSSQLEAVRAAAGEAAATAAPGGQGEAHSLLRELSALSAETGERLEATALVLNDTDRLGTVRDINDALGLARLGVLSGSGQLSVRMGSTELGPVRPTDDGRWTGPGITEPFHSPEGAAAALIRADRAQAAVRRQGRTP
ncbi:hypothetical protein [Streptomyces violascens]|uniref:hypothetical protein n=1 Tax=Streptomyces violascens TaxID=67381 RepID=UPI0016783710|nr:hypothetical protein [Streptomyces violascens]GGU38945.1 hypothetical protein GCM10010289_69780 [Streptomyces violascens]